MIEGDNLVTYTLVKLTGEEILSFSLVPPFPVGLFLQERICSCRSKFFPVRLYPRVEGFRSQRSKQACSHKSCLSLNKWHIKITVSQNTLTIFVRDNKTMNMHTPAKQTPVLLKMITVYHISGIPIIVSSKEHGQRSKCNQYRLYLFEFRLGPGGLTGAFVSILYWNLAFNS